MPKQLDVTGQMFGRLVALRRVPSVHENRTMWLCRCTCGAEKAIDLSALRSGKVVSCSCYKNEKAAEPIHGESRRGLHSAEYRTWQGIKKRCFQESYSEWRYYGGRGITVCDAWRNSFERFLSDMGRKPTPEHSIDRINVDGNYEPGNCRWATASEQNRNRRPRKKKI